MLESKNIGVAYIHHDHVQLLKRSLPRSVQLLLAPIDDEEGEILAIALCNTSNYLRIFVVERDSDRHLQT